ncbi:uncharacterized protein LOC135222843 [Macrobrachium nipponense]|uniref:uncharacterized protein LOC135222843 n=1 Tax=Macrobrachium nipponense TaxID=159736 RepID=UPI0030C8BBBE
MEMDEIKTERKPRRSSQDPEAGEPTEDPGGEEGSEEGEDGEGKVVKKETVVLRLGEAKLTGPMRFITCYAAGFTFLIMAGFIVWLLMISPPFNVTPVLRPDEMLAHIPPHLKGSTTTDMPPDTEEPEFSSDFNQA